MVGFQRHQNQQKIPFRWWINSTVGFQWLDSAASCSLASGHPHRQDPYWTCAQGDEGNIRWTSSFEWLCKAEEEEKSACGQVRSAHAYVDKQRKIASHSLVSHPSQHSAACENWICCVYHSHKSNQILLLPMLSQEKDRSVCTNQILLFHRN